MYDVARALPTALPNTLPGLNLQFAVLGRLAVGGAEPVTVGRRRERCLLGILLLEAGTTVPVDRLVSLLWDDEPPATARASLHSHVARLRAALDGHDSGLRLVRGPGGYLADVDPDLVDVRRFRALVERGRADTDLARRAGTLREALGLWRGPILAGDASDRLRDRIGAPLHELRLTATELMIDAELERGRHAEVTGELTALTAEHPARERLAAQLMLALYRSGRQADALRFYRAFSERLAAAFGADPGTELTRLHLAVLRQDPELDYRPPAPEAAPLPVTRPALLPPGVADFTGRARQTQQVRSALADPDPPAAATRVALVTGPGGVGKTAFAVHLAHQVRDHFPDGVLYANLHGMRPAPAEPAEVAARFLHALGVPRGNVPASLDERVRLYRGLLAGRRVLVVLDDARDLAQLRPLLPGTPESATVVTSRRRLGALACTERVTLGVFEPDEAMRLLRRICGADRVDAEASVAADVIGRCGRLPLAIRVAGARLAVRAHWPLRRLADRLSAEHRRLDELAADDLAVRASFTISYRDISADGRRALRRLALLAVPDFGAWVAAPLLDVPLEQAEDLVDELVDAHLLETVGTDVPGVFRYRFHDLIRLCAREQAEDEEEPDELRESLHRVLGEWLALTGTASARLPYRLLTAIAEPRSAGFAEPAEDPFGWLAAERAALVAAVRQAAETGAGELAWRLADAARDLFYQRDHTDEYLTVHRIAAVACERSRDALGTAVMSYGLACQAGIGDLDVTRCLALAEQAAAAFAELGQEMAEVDARVLAASLHRRAGDHAVSRQALEDCIVLAAQVGNAPAEAAAWRSLGILNREQQRLGEALRCFTAALDLAREHRIPDVEAFAYRGQGVIHRELGDFAAAETAFEAALERYRRLGQAAGQGTALIDLGQLHMRRGDRRAGVALRQALAIFEREGLSSDHAIALRALGEWCLADGDPAAAVTHLQGSLRIWRVLREPWGTALCFSALGTAHQAAGDPDAARAAWRAARDRYREVGNDSEADRMTDLIG